LSDRRVFLIGALKGRKSSRKMFWESIISSNRGHQKRGKEGKPTRGLHRRERQRRRGIVDIRERSSGKAFETGAG